MTNFIGLSFTWCGWIEIADLRRSPSEDVSALRVAVEMWSGIRRRRACGSGGKVGRAARGPAWGERFAEAESAQNRQENLCSDKRWHMSIEI